MFSEALSRAVFQPQWELPGAWPGGELCPPPQEQRGAHALGETEPAAAGKIVADQRHLDT